MGKRGRSCLTPGPPEPPCPPLDCTFWPCLLDEIRWGLNPACPCTPCLLPPRAPPLASSSAFGAFSPHWHYTTDDKQATALEREVIMAARKGLDPYNILPLKAASGTKEDPNLVLSITNKRIVGCICVEDNSTITCFGLRKGETQRCPSYGTITSWCPTSLLTERLHQVTQNVLQSFFFPIKTSHCIGSFSH
uniref:Cytochrome c oxidase subunit 5B, mitochondrial n=1 Tax=Pongo abelii TaxID=9601 RepID=A0A8I5TLW1_PONAB